MFTRTARNIKTVRFSRWSRAGYAVFLSLSVVVTIGVLTSSVSEKSLLKSNAIPNVFSENQISLFTENEPDDDVLFEQIAEIIVSEQTTDIAAAQNLNHYILTRNRLNGLLSMQPIFLFSPLIDFVERCFPLRGTLRAGLTTTLIKPNKSSAFDS